MPVPNSSLAFSVANDPDFIKRVVLILSDVCTDVLAEANTVTAHDQRAAYAVRALADLRKEAARAALILIAEFQTEAAAVADQSDFADSAIEAGVGVVFNSLAGIYTPE